MKVTEGNFTGRIFHSFFIPLGILPKCLRVRLIDRSPEDRWFGIREWRLMYALWDTERVGQRFFFTRGI